MDRQKITVVGIGYVGLGVGVMLATAHDVTFLDIDKKKVEMIEKRQSPIKDGMIELYLSEQKDLAISATTDEEAAYKDADFIIIAVPTNYDENTKYFDTHIVENTVNEALRYKRDACVVIKSTIPVGYTASLRKRLEEHGFRKPNVIFSPEFLREGTALKDNLFPSRVIAGCDMSEKEQVTLARNYLELIKSATIGEYKELVMGSTEAEAVKLFANTYLAMRVAYFNELDTYAECNELNARDIIEGMCYDPRIGNQYNNPSFGYGGYCFPKDTKQLLANFEDVPQNLISAIVESNETRKEHIFETVRKWIGENIMKIDGEVSVGIYRLAMKSGSDNFRKSAILDIVEKFKDYGWKKIYIYEPTIQGNEFERCEVIKSLDWFKKNCSIILTNRYSEELDDVKDKVYTRDIFNEN